MVPALRALGALAFVSFVFFLTGDAVARRDFGLSIGRNHALLHEVVAELSPMALFPPRTIGRRAQRRD
jgi:hypothetical protein